MLAYYISESNSYTIRTQPTASSQFTMSMQNMYTLENTTMSISGVTYNGYESMLGFTASISGAIVGSEYRLELYNSGAANLDFNTGGNTIWYGSLQAYKSSSAEKSEYENQIPPISSSVSENKYIIMK
jgi:hypothetical protein